MTIVAHIIDDNFELSARLLCMKEFDERATAALDRTEVKARGFHQMGQPVHYDCNKIGKQQTEHIQDRNAKTALKTGEEPIPNLSFMDHILVLIGRPTDRTSPSAKRMRAAPTGAAALFADFSTDEQDSGLNVAFCGEEPPSAELNR